MDRYKVEIFYSVDDEAWIANAPDITYCSAHGATRAEALAELETALRGTLEVFAEAQLRKAKVEAEPGKCFVWLKFKHPTLGIIDMDKFFLPKAKCDEAYAAMKMRWQGVDLFFSDACVATQRNAPELACDCYTFVTSQFP